MYRYAEDRLCLFGDAVNDLIVLDKAHIRSTIFILVLIATGFSYKYGRSFWVPAVQKVAGKKTVEDVILKYGDMARSRLGPYFSQANLDYPPKAITFLALKKERLLEVWASNGNSYQFIRKYEIVKISGKPGPKLNEGDHQVPEGIYRIAGLNPNSRYHLSLKLNYPNDFDLYHAKKEGRTQPGSNIFIHGKDVSVGCLAMGDKTIEDLFVLVHDTGKNNTKVVIAPRDPRRSELDATLSNGPDWLPRLYEMISEEFNKYRA